MEKKFRKNELEATRQTVKFFETLLRASNDGILITDANQNIILVNEAFCNILGRRKREMIETNLFIWLGEFEGNAMLRWSDLQKRVRVEGKCDNVDFRIRIHKLS